MEWKEYNNCQLCDTISETYKGKSNSVVLINTSDVLEGKVLNHKRVPNKGLKGQFKKTFKKNDILYSEIRPANKRFAYINFSPNDYIASTKLMVLRSKPIVSSYFLFQILKSVIVLKNLQMLAESRSGTFPQITYSELSNVRVKVPPLPVQDKIVGILSALDSKIENNNKINANLEAQAQALFKSWFVDFTPFKDQPFVDSELGPIPQGWKVGTLGDIANIIMGQSPAGSSYNERGNGVIFYQGRTEFGFRFPNVRLYTTMPKRYAEPMSILLSVRAPVGDINVAIEKCCIGRGLASISSKRGLHSFLLYLVKSLKNRLEVFNGEGTVFGSINKNTLMQFKIIIPPIEMQEKFNEIIQRHDCMVLELHKEIINLSTQRDTLLPKLMSGEIKL